jgi:hypothetical protein
VGSITENLPDNENLKYTILSHIWESGEVTFKDLDSSKGKGKAGYKKIRFCAEQAKCHGYQYSWVDTCYIDNSNQVELNKLFQCFDGIAKHLAAMYICPISRSPTISKKANNYSARAFRMNKWFTRGWRLQELLVPASVEFFESD